MAALDKLVRSIKDTQYKTPQVPIKRLSIRRMILLCSSGENSDSGSLLSRSSDLEDEARSTWEGSCFSASIMAGLVVCSGTADMFEREQRCLVPVRGDEGTKDTLRSVKDGRMLLYLDR